MATVQYPMLPRWLLPLSWCNRDDEVHRSVTGLCVNVGYYFVWVDNVGVGLPGCMVSTFIRICQQFLNVPEPFCVPHTM